MWEQVCSRKNTCVCLSAMTSDPANIPALDCFVYLSNIDSSVTWKQLKALMDIVEEPIKSLYIFDGWKSERKEGIVEFVYPSGASLALEELNGSKLGCCHIGLRPARIDDHGVPHSLKRAMGVEAPLLVRPESKTVLEEPKQDKSSAPVAAGGSKAIIQGAPNRVLFISNIPFEKGTVETVKELFTPFGYVEKVRLGQTDDGTFRGFANVVMQTVAQAIAAQKALCEMEFGGRKLLVIFDKYGDSPYYQQK